MQSKKDKDVQLYVWFTNKGGDEEEEAGYNSPFGYGKIISENCETAGINGKHFQATSWVYFNDIFSSSIETDEFSKKANKAINSRASTVLVRLLYYICHT